ncbi:unnamed protein product [Mytilus edulis]|uniref:Uncharacterized protein n=1 Tax=Mytilus edulis TaxID=6550 RepID=A0A8S3SCI6_MYTED|nr:unnamed protein product [Mytilus edulis]
MLNGQSKSDSQETLDNSIFLKKKDDDTVGLSIEDKEFLKVMDENVHQNSDGNWEAPLPFRYPRQRLPNNRSHAFKRAMNLDVSLRRDEKKKEHLFEFMKKVLERKHAEIAPPLSQEDERRYGLVSLATPREAIDLLQRTRESLQTGGTHTGENIANALKEVKEKWSLPDIIAVTDNAANEKKAFQILNWIRFGCYGHRINHVVKNALSVSKEISHVIATGRKLVTFYHQSTSANDSLMAKQKLLLQEELVMSQLLQCSGIYKNRHTKKPSKQKGEIYLLQ